MVKETEFIFNFFVFFLILLILLYISIQYFLKISKLKFVINNDHTEKKGIRKKDTPSILSDQRSQDIISNNMYRCLCIDVNRFK